MRRALAAVVLLSLAAGSASAWAFDLRASVDPGLSLRTSLLVAGALDVAVDGNATQVVVGAPVVDRIRFGDHNTVLYCPDIGGQPAEPGQCRERLTDARIRLLRGGVLVAPQDEGEVSLASPAAAAALGGANLTVNRVEVGPGIFVGGRALVVSASTAFEVRPIGEDASIEVRAAQGHRTYNGTRFTLLVTEADALELESRQAFLRLPPEATVRVRQAPLPVAEEELAAEELHRLLRAVVPPDRADRRADLVNAFGPFQVAPALLNGVVAASANLSFEPGGAPSGFALLRVEDATVRRQEGNWTGAGNATYVVSGTRISERPGAATGLPLVVPAVLVAVAVLGRVVTGRTTPSRRRRALRRALRALASVLLFVVAAWTIAGLFGVNVLAHGGVLSLRTRVQLALLAAGMALVAYALVGVAAASLARSVLAWRGRAGAVVLPTVVGALAAAVFLLVARDVLVALVAAFVRL